MEQNQQPLPPVFNPQQQPSAPQQAPQYQPRVTVRPMMGFLEAIKTCLKKYADFKGRARRSEFWWFALFCFIVYLATSFVMGYLSVWLADFVDMEPTQLAIVLVTLIMLAFVIPFFAALTRRLHDTGRSGWWPLIFFLCGIAYYVCYFRIMWPLMDKLATDPFGAATAMTEAIMESPAMATIMSVSGMAVFVMIILHLIFAVLDSKWGENKYGPSPKYQ